jgi:hypothetical protein
MLNDIGNWKSRMIRAKELYVLDIVRFMRERLINAAPDILIGGKMKNYAKDLQVGLLDTGDDETVVCLFLRDYVTKLTDSESPNTVLYFNAVGGSPPWVRVLERHSPWPADSIPLPIEKGVAKVISRLARGDEMRAIRERLDGKSSEIESEMAQYGAKEARVKLTMNGKDIDVHVDIGFNILRKEFGWDGADQVSHWRPVFKEVRRYAKKSIAKVAKFIQTGDESIFDLPDKLDSVTMNDKRNGAVFEKAISPFV